MMNENENNDCPTLIQLDILSSKLIVKLIDKTDGWMRGLDTQTAFRENHLGILEKEGRMTSNFSRFNLVVDGSYFLLSGAH